MFSFALCSSSLSHELILFTEPVGYSRLKVTGMIERSQRSKLHRASICPQQGDKIESLVLNMARVYIQILGGPVPPPPLPWELCAYLLPSYHSLLLSLLWCYLLLEYLLPSTCHIQKTKRWSKRPTKLKNIIVRH